MHCCNDVGLSLWTLDDNAGDGTWTKNFKFEKEGFRMDQKFLYLGDGLFVSSNMSFKTLTMYAYKKNKTKKLHHMIIPELFYKHTESLISIPGFINF